MAVRRTIYTLCGVLPLYSALAYAEGYFDPNLLNNPDGAPAVENLQPILAGEMPAGVYHVQVTVNGRDILTVRDIRFDKNQAKELIPCLPLSIYQAAHVDFKTRGVALTVDDPQECILLSEAIPSASSHLDSAKMVLALSFPQEIQKEMAEDEVPSTLWDDGIPALLSGYQFSGNKTVRHNAASDNSGVFFSFKNGANIGGWRLRQTANLQQNKGERAHWDSNDSYLEHAISALKGELTLGESYTSGDLFDTVRILGVQVSSDTQMLPSSLNGFSPTIRGIAHSNAVVTVSQKGYVLFQTNVGQGPFVIKSLAPVSTGGTLDVTVREADGSEQHFSQSFSSLASLQREGGLKYNLALGRYSDQESAGQSPDLLQASGAQGLPLNITLFSGMQLTKFYHALNAGLGSEFGRLGAVATAVTWENSREGSLMTKSSDGYSIKTVWANDIGLTDTNLNASLTQNKHRYLALSDTLNDQETSDIAQRQYSLSVSQPFPANISAFAAINGTHYRNHNSSMYQFGLSTTLWKIMSSVTFTLNKDAQSESTGEKHHNMDKQLFLNFSLPMSAFVAHSTTTLNTSMSTDLKGNSDMSVGASGDIGVDSSLNWSTNIDYDAQHAGDDSHSGDFSLSYKGRHGDFNGGYAQDASQKQFVYGGSGEFVLHQHGLTIGQYSDGAMALISAPGAADILIENHSGIATDQRGYTTVPDVTPYNFNEIKINKDHLNKHIAFDTLSQTVVPTKDAVVLAEFKPTVGRKVLFTVDKQGSAAPIPFGAEAKLVTREKIYFVGDSGALFIDGVPERGEIVIDYQHQACRVNYQLPAEDNALVTQQQVICIPGPGNQS